MEEQNINKKTALESHAKIIRESISLRNKEVSDVLMLNNSDAVKDRIGRLKARYLSMLDTDIFRLPSKVVKTGELECRGYRIEKLVMESLDKYYVPMNLYIPESQKGNEKPAILVNMGHYIEGKSLPENQIMCANLALLGFIVLTFDPMCQGERDMFPDRADEHWKKDMWVVEQHMKVGNQCYLLGYNSISYFLNDAKKAVDYLVSRQDVDKDRIGVTGQSGGGTLAYLLAALDDRISAAAPVHCLSTMDRICKNGIGDSEQSMINMLAKGFDLTDFLWLIAPRPLMINAGTKDFFSIDGVNEIYSELEKVYRVLGYERNVQLCEIDVGHIISKEVRESLYGFFNTVFLQGVPCTEQETPVLTNEQLLCGVAKLRGRTPLEYNKIMLERVKRENLRKDYSEENVIEAIRSLIPFDISGFEAGGIFSNSCMDGYKRVFIKDTNDLSFVIDVYRKRDDTDIIVYIDLEDSADICQKASENMSNAAIVRPFASCKNSYKSDACYDDETKLAYQGIVSGKSIFEIRLEHTLYALDYLRQEGLCGKIEVYGSGQGALLALFASILNKNVFKVYCEKLLCTFSCLFGQKDYLINETDLIPGLLKEFDVDTLLKLFAEKVNVISTINEIKEIIPNKAVTRG